MTQIGAGRHFEFVMRVFDRRRPAAQFRVESPDVIDACLRPLSDPAKIDRADRWFDRFGDAAVYLGWVTPLARSFISYAAGIVRMPLPRFLLLTVAGCLTWCFALTGIGWAVGANWSKVHHDFRYADFVVLGLLVLAAAYLVLRFIRTQHSRA